VDRLGARLEFIPHLFHTSNNLPSGQRGWYLWKRTGADLVNNSAFVHLISPNTAVIV
jgi:predicted phage gp36 major capsid-like protein